MTYEVDPDYMRIAEEGVKFIASKMSEATAFVEAFFRRNYDSNQAPFQFCVLVRFL